jgi:hypothetical protein
MAENTKSRAKQAVDKAEQMPDAAPSSSLECEKGGSAQATGATVPTSSGSVEGGTNTQGNESHVKGTINPDEEGKDIAPPEITDLPVPIPGGGTKTVHAWKMGALYIPIDKIRVWGTGKVTFPQKAELDALRKERRSDQKAFAKQPEKQKRLKELEGPEYNFQRSQGNLNALTKAGFSASSPEDENRILVKLMQDAAAAGVDMKPGTKCDLRSEVSGPPGKLIIHSVWKVQKRIDTGELIFRLDTFYYAV